MSEQTLQEPSTVEVAKTFQRIVVAYDASASAERALSNAINLATRFGSEILLAEVTPLVQYQDVSQDALLEERTRLTGDLESIRSRLSLAGISSRIILRSGIVGDTLFRLCCEEGADLLLLGAYGYGLQDRETLGSTAECLLRALPCPVLTYGPNVTIDLTSARVSGPILLPISLPLSQEMLTPAIRIIKLFRLPVELIHIQDHASTATVRSVEEKCERLASYLRAAGVKAHWSLYFGLPSSVIVARVNTINSPFLLMPLRWRNGLSSMTSDNVAAHVIRQSRVPVMTYRVS